MSRNGSGTYTLPAGNPVVTGTTISSTWANNTLTDIATALTGSLAADGQTTATGNLKMGANRITGLADGIASTDGATVSQLTAASATYLLKASNLSDVANATTSRTNLTAAKSGANSDITSITGLTTPLTVAQGGTGAATLTANNVLLGNGTSAPQVVAPSTTGNVLTSNGTTWVSSTPSSGKLLQIVQGTVVTTSTSTSSSTFVTTGITASITPSSASSKILVFANTALDNSASGRSGFFTIYRNSTNVVDSGSTSGNGFNGVFADASRIQTALSITFLDAPSTTSATTYTIYIRSASGSIVANQSCSGYVTVMEIAA